MIAVLNIGKKQVTCGKCKSLLEYTQNDVQKYEINHDYLGDYDVVTGVKCPVCGSIVKDTV
jgi:RNase P subunit RPR2